MASLQVLSEIDQTLDELIANATELRHCEEGTGQCAHLEHKQEMLLNTLLSLNNSIDDKEKYQLWQKSPNLYMTLEKKIVRLSRLNQKLLKPADQKPVKKTRIHQRKSKKTPTQLSLDLNS